MSMIRVTADAVQSDDGETITFDGAVYRRERKEAEKAKAKASPRPWLPWLNEETPGIHTQGVRGLICIRGLPSPYHDWPANRDLILKAVNNFDEIVIWLREFVACPRCCVDCGRKANGLLSTLDAPGAGQ